MKHITPGERTADLRAMLDGAVGGIPGVQMLDFSLERNAGGMLMANCRLLNWGPTLHGRDHTWNFSMPQNIKLLREMETGLTLEEAGETLAERRWEGEYDDLEGDMTTVTRDEMAAAFALAIRMIQEEQGTLARIGAEFGLTDPMRNGVLRIDHFRMDRRTVTMMIDRHGASGTVRILREALADLLKHDRMGLRTSMPRQNARAMGKPFHVIYRDFGADSDDGYPHLWISQRLNARYYDGTSVTLPEEVPETIKSAAIGRRLGDVVSGVGHPAMDDAIVEEVRGQDIDLVPDLIVLGRHDPLLEALAAEQ